MQRTVAVLAGVMMAVPANAQSRREGSVGERTAASGRYSVFAPSSDPERPRSDIGMPIVSFLLPGFDQWWEGQTGSAAAYTGVALGGLFYAATITEANDLEGRAEREKEEREAAGEDPEEVESMDQKDIATRKAMLGMLAYQGAGGMSAYHTFRTAVRTRKARGQYAFLRHEETPLDVLTAPFNFRYMARTSTLIPLGIGAALAALILNSEPPDEVERTSFTQADAFFTSAFSYNAGTHEEAMFRGWLQPVMREYWNSEFWANAAQSVLFAAAHLNTNPQPLPQLILGYHLGNVTMDDGWRIGEAVFIHVWWDVLAFATLYHYKQKAPEETASKINPVLWLPPLHLAF